MQTVSPPAGLRTRFAGFICRVVVLLAPAVTASAGQLTLEARDAVIKSAAVKYVAYWEHNCLMDWQSQSACASWEIDIARAGEVSIDVVQASPADFQPGEYTITIGDRSIRAMSTRTASPEKFETIDVGKISAAPGKHIQVTVSAAQIENPANSAASQPATVAQRMPCIRAVVLRGVGFEGVHRKWTSGVAATTEQFLGDNVRRFIPAELDPRSVPMSFALQSPPQGLAAVIAPVSYAKPTFGHRTFVSASWTSSPAYMGAKRVVSAHVPVDVGTSLYGTGEIAGRLLRNGQVSVCWNTDAYGYQEQSKSLYQSHPWVLAVKPDGAAYGVLADTTWQCEIDLTAGIRFSSDGPPFPVIVIEGPSPEAVVTRLGQLTGFIPMPPLWALGYQQCRFSYFPEQRVREIAQGFRKRRIPCDVIWLDIDYMDGFRIFTFDKKHFPDPTRINSELHTLGFHTVWMIDPGVKVDPGYAVYQQGTSGDHWVRTAQGGEFHGDVWPGACAFPDFTQSRTRQWWSGLYKSFLAQGVDGVWNDMNEPAVFYPGKPTGTMPPDNMHRGGDGLQPGPHARYHNVYGMLMARATREGIAAANPHKRPFVLTRANFIGGQRYAATWSGDNQATWDHLRHSIPMILNLGLSGQPFSGPDIGGFEGNGDGRLFARWMGIGALFPFARGHSTKGSKNKEPWEFGSDVEETCRLALQRRYRLMPYLYTLFHESSMTGKPVMKPVFFADPADAALRDVDDAFLLGDDLLVRAAVNADGKPSTVRPSGIWRNIAILDESDRPDLPALAIRGGAIISLGPVREYLESASLDSITLLICLDSSGKARGILYEDAGDGYGYQKGQFRQTEYAAVSQGKIVRVTIAGSTGELPRPQRTLDVIVVGENGLRRATGRDGDTIEVQ